MSGEMSVRDMLDGVDYVTKEKLCRCTVRYTNSYGITKVRHWRTDVLTLYPNGQVAIHLHGYWTATTVMRVNRYLPNGYVYQRRGKHFFGGGDGKTYHYKEGMIVDKLGIPISDDVIEYIPRERTPGSTTSKW